MRLIDIENFKPHPKYTNEMNDAILAQMFRQPIIDAEPVVRCKDCNGSQVYDDGKYIGCCRLGIKMGFWDFCSYGDRKDGDNAT